MQGLGSHGVLREGRVRCHLVATGSNPVSSADSSRDCAGTDQLPGGTTCSPWNGPSTGRPRSAGSASSTSSPANAFWTSPAEPAATSRCSSGLSGPPAKSPASTPARRCWRREQADLGQRMDERDHPARHGGRAHPGARLVAPVRRGGHHLRAFHHGLMAGGLRAIGRPVEAGRPAGGDRPCPTDRRVAGPRFVGTARLFRWWRSPVATTVATGDEASSPSRPRGGTGRAPCILPGDTSAGATGGEATAQR